MSVHPGLRPSDSPSFRVSFRQFSTLFSNMLWHIELKFCIWLCFTVLQIKFQCCQFASSFVGVMPLLELRILEIHSFQHFSLTCFDILSWNFVYDFVLMYYRSNLSVVKLHQFLLELCPFCNLQYWKYTVFRTFRLHALTYWAEILHMTLFYCTTDQVWVLSVFVNFCGSNAPFGTQNTENTQFSTLFSYMLRHIELKFCTWRCFTEIQIQFKCCQFELIFVGVMPLFELWILEIQFSALFFYMLWHIELKFFIWLCLMYYRSSLSVVNLCPSILSEI